MPAKLAKRLEVNCQTASGCIVQLAGGKVQGRALGKYHPFINKSLMSLLRQNQKERT